MWFPTQLGTNAALIEMCDQWWSEIDNGKLIGVVFLDICKAFDSSLKISLKINFQFVITN